MIVNAVLFFALITYLINKLKVYTYWYNKNVKGPTPIPILGNIGSVIFMKKSISDVLKNVYERYPNEKVVGLYRGLTPILLIKDPEIIKHVLVKDFIVFQERGFTISSGRLSKNLFVADGDTWRVLRQNLTPTFTSKKMKEMMPLIQQCAENLKQHVNILAASSDHEIRSISDKYTLDVIGSCAFGIDVDAYSKTKNKFREMAHRLFNPPIYQKVFFLLDLIIPGIRSYVPFARSKDVHNFFSNLVSKVIREREGKIKLRKDFMDLLITLKEKGTAKRRDGDNVTEIKIDDNVIEAQAVSFYSAGYEAAAGVMTFLFYELALNQHIQNKLHTEISNILKKHNNQITYESLKEMIYLQMVINETLRKYTINGFIMRKAKFDYNMPGTDVFINEGTPIVIALSGLHNDTKYFKNPDKFDPENFSPGKTKKRPQCAFIPFGVGPRNCIGTRFADMQSTIGIVTFLQHFKLIPSSKTTNQLRFDPKGTTLTSVDGVWLRILKRK